MRHSDPTLWLALFALAAILATIASGLAALVLHELGHALAARVAGLDVVSLRLGGGRLLASTRLGHTHLELRAPSLFAPSGLAEVHLRSAHRARLRLFVSVAAGPLANALLAAPAAAALVPFATVIPRLPPAAFLALASWAGMNGFIAAFSLVPYRFAKGTLQSDGLRLLRLPRLTDAQILETLSRGRLRRALLAWTDGNLARTEQLLGFDELDDPAAPVALARAFSCLRSNVQLRRGQLPLAVARLRTLRSWAPSPAVHAAVLCDLAATNLLLGPEGDPDEALACATEAATLQPESALVRLVLGAALVRTGQLVAGAERLAQPCPAEPPTTLEAWNAALGLCLRAAARDSLGQPDLAAQDRLQAATLDPACPFLRART